MNEVSSGKKRKGSKVTMVATVERSVPAGSDPGVSLELKDPSDLFAEAYRLQEEGRFEEALYHYHSFVKRRPGDPAGYNNLGNCLRSLGRDEEAISRFEKALELEPGRTSSRLNLSLARLATGDYPGAWPDYESRLETIDFRKELLDRRDLQWDGSILSKGQRLFLFGNQGLGDELQCLRFLPEVFTRAHDIVLELQAPTCPLMVDLPEHVSLIRRGDKVPPFHRWCEIFSLPYLLEVAVDRIPPPQPLLFDPDPEVVRFLGNLREDAPGKRQVGIVWSGNPANSLNRFRVCPLAAWQPILELEGMQFFSLQKGSPVDDLKHSGQGEAVTDLGPLLHDFRSTATAMKELDLVITTDTSVPHLAGALGLEAWVLLHFPADWRWGRKGSTTPWYPSLRLFRQRERGNWSAIIGELKRALLKRFS